MKVAVNTTTKTIVDILPDNATESHKFLINNSYSLLDVNEPMLEDGTFRDLTSAELSPILAKDANIQYELGVAALTAGVPNSEISTWTKQESESRSWLADDTASTPLIDAMCAARGVDKAYLVAKIVEKADAYAAAIGTLTGIRQKQEDELKG